MLSCHGWILLVKLGIWVVEGAVIFSALPLACTLECPLAVPLLAGVDEPEGTLADRPYDQSCARPSAPENRSARESIAIPVAY